MKNDWDGTCGVFIPEGVVVGKVAEPMGGRVTGRGGWSHNRLWKGEAYISASAGGTTYTARPIPVILHPPAHEDGGDRGFRNVGY